jgi:hypothetical protein
MPYILASQLRRSQVGADGTGGIAESRLPQYGKRIFLPLTTISPNRFLNRLSIGDPQHSRRNWSFIVPAMTTALESLCELIAPSLGMRKRGQCNEPKVCCSPRANSTVELYTGVDRHASDG